MKIFGGYFIHSLALNELQVFHGIIAVDSHGKIVAIEESQNISDLAASYQTKHQIDPNDIELFTTDTLFFIPGFIDSHTHAPQIVNLGRGYDLPLLEWLNKYTIPLERQFEDIEFAAKVYEYAVQRFLSEGTTTCAYYGTVHVAATKILADCMVKFGQRGFVGKVCMDINTPSLFQPADKCLEDNQALIDYLQGNELVQPILTPRFALFCSPKLMLGLGELAKKNDLLIQSHLSENKGEIEAMRALYPHLNYTQVYDEHNLLNDKTVMAHCVHLSEQEVELIKQRNAGISHCPTSNFNIMSGVLNVKPLLQRHIKVGLGTDVSGGSSCSILEAIRSAVIASKVVSHEPIDFRQAFYMGTLGNAFVLNVEKKVGSFEVGKFFDANLVDVKAKGTRINAFNCFQVQDYFEKFIYSGDDRNIVRVYVNGKLVVNKE